jgi:hypothetical protein
MTSQGLVPDIDVGNIHVTAGMAVQWDNDNGCSLSATCAFLSQKTIAISPN